MQEETMNQVPQQDEDMNKTLNSGPDAAAPASGNSRLNLVLTTINLILLAGLAILYFIVLKPAKPETNNRLSAKTAEGSIRVAYVNSDSIMANYELVKSMRNTLESKTRELENELRRKQAAFEKDAGYFQEQVNKRSISEASAQEIYAQLMNEQQKLYELREKYTAELADQEYELNLVLLDSLNNFLDRYNKKVNFDYIFSHTRGGNILHANDSLDITQDVLKLLNEEYRKTSGK